MIDQHLHNMLFINRSGRFCFFFYFFPSDIITIFSISCFTCHFAIFPCFLRYIRKVFNMHSFFHPICQYMHIFSMKIIMGTDFNSMRSPLGHVDKLSYAAKVSWSQIEYHVNCFSLCFFYNVFNGIASIRIRTVNV